MDDCIFCKIVAGEMPSHKLYEDEHVFVFLDIFPVKEGHVLVVPKVHSNDLFDADPMVFGHIMSAIQKVGNALKQTTSADGFNVITNIGPAAGQTVFHTHFHIIPRHEGDGLASWPHAERSNEELATFAESLRSHL